jgi:hypothetical protein
MDWIIRNKEWLFSGIGVAAIMAIIGIVRVILSRRRQPAIQPHQTEEGPLLQQQIVIPVPEAHGPSILDIPLSKILGEIESRPPFQRDDVKKHYIGTRIRFKGVLRSLSKRENDEVKIRLNTAPDNWYPRVNFVAKVAVYPQLKFLEENAPMSVVGRIMDLGAAEATLEDVKIEF